MRRILARMRVFRALVLGSLCVALVLMSGMIQAAHFHADGQLDHDCALCMTAHSVAQAAAPIALIFTSRQVEALAAPRTIARARDAVHFRLASRPPPLPFLA
ncbi:MAG TPA: hypothetical protein VMD92_05905 [Acidobacteriaceae bacterium]|nr:hypothetical protein [Acidobacteriaceae bacterium]